MHLVFSKILGKLVIKYVLRVYFKILSAKYLSNDAYAMFCVFYFLYKCIYCEYSFELHRQVYAIQMGTSMQFKWVPTTYAFIKKVDKKYTGCNLKTTELLDCALKGVYAVIRSNMVYCGTHHCNRLGDSNEYPQFLFSWRSTKNGYHFWLKT